MGRGAQQVTAAGILYGPGFRKKNKRTEPTPPALAPELGGVIPVEKYDADGYERLIESGDTVFQFPMARRARLDQVRDPEKGMARVWIQGRLTDDKDDGNELLLGAHLEGDEDPGRSAYQTGSRHAIYYRGASVSGLLTAVAKLHHRLAEQDFHEGRIEDWGEGAKTLSPQGVKTALGKINKARQEVAGMGLTP